MPDTAEAWRVLEADAAAAQSRSILSLFEAEPGGWSG